MTESGIKAGIEAMSFEQAMAALTDIVNRLERGETELEDAITLYERGKALRAHCDALLGKAELRVEKIAGTQDGAPVQTEPFAVE